MVFWKGTGASYAFVSAEGPQAVLRCPCLVRTGQLAHNYVWSVIHVYNPYDSHTTDHTGASKPVVHLWWPVRCLHVNLTEPVAKECIRTKVDVTQRHTYKCESRLK